MDVNTAESFDQKDKEQIMELIQKHVDAKPRVAGLSASQLSALAGENLASRLEADSACEPSSVLFPRGSSTPVPLAKSTKDGTRFWIVHFQMRLLNDRLSAMKGVILHREVLAIAGLLIQTINCICADFKASHPNVTNLTDSLRVGIEVVPENLATQPAWVLSLEATNALVMGKLALDDMPGLRMPTALKLAREICEKMCGEKLPPFEFKVVPKDVHDAARAAFAVEIEQQANQEEKAQEVEKEEKKLARAGRLADQIQIGDQRHHGAVAEAARWRACDRLTTLCQLAREFDLSGPSKLRGGEDSRWTLYCMWRTAVRCRAYSMEHAMHPDGEPRIQIVQGDDRTPPKEMEVEALLTVKSLPVLLRSAVARFGLIYGVLNPAGGLMTPEEADKGKAQYKKYAAIHGLDPEDTQPYMASVAGVMAQCLDGGVATLLSEALDRGMMMSIATELVNALPQSPEARRQRLLDTCPPPDTRSRLEESVSSSTWGRLSSACAWTAWFDDVPSVMPGCIASIALNELDSPLDPMGAAHRHWTIHGACTEKTWPQLFRNANLWAQFALSHQSTFEAVPNVDMPECYDISVFVASTNGPQPMARPPYRYPGESPGCDGGELPKGCNQDYPANQLPTSQWYALLEMALIRCDPVGVNCIMTRLFQDKATAKERYESTPFDVKVPLGEGEEVGDRRPVPRLVVALSGAFEAWVAEPDGHWDCDDHYLRQQARACVLAITAHLGKHLSEASTENRAALLRMLFFDDWIAAVDMFAQDLSPHCLRRMGSTYDKTHLLIPPGRCMMGRLNHWLVLTAGVTSNTLGRIDWIVGNQFFVHPNQNNPNPNRDYTPWRYHDAYDHSRSAALLFAYAVRLNAWEAFEWLVETLPGKVARIALMHNTTAWDDEHTSGSDPLDGLFEAIRDVKLGDGTARPYRARAIRAIRESVAGYALSGTVPDLSGMDDPAVTDRWDRLVGIVQSKKNGEADQELADVRSSSHAAGKAAGRETVAQSRAEERAQERRGKWGASSSLSQPLGTLDGAQAIAHVKAQREAVREAAEKAAMIRAQKNSFRQVMARNNLVVSKQMQAAIKSIEAAALAGMSDDPSTDVADLVA